MITRRNLLRTTAWLPIGFVVAGCAGTTGSTGTTTDPGVLQRVIQYGQGVAGAFTAILPTLQALPGVGGSSVLSTLVSVVGEAVKVLPTVASIAGAANPISAIFGALPQIAALVGSVGNLPPNVQMWINATASLAQVVGPLVGLALTLAAPAPGVVMAAPTAHPDEQVAYLQLLALQRR